VKSRVPSGLWLQPTAGKMLRLCAAIGALSFSGLVSAQAYLECGTAACGPSVQPWSTNLTTGINDLNVGGDLFDVSFTTTQPASSPFVLSTSAALPGQPLTGIDADSAISNFYANLPPPYGTGPGAYPIVGDQGPAFITAFGPAGSASSDFFGSTQIFDAVQSIVGGGNGDGFDGEVGQVGNGQFYPPAAAAGGPLNSNYGVFYTTWTPISAITAPEIDPASTVGALTLLLGSVVVLRGRRRGIGARLQSVNRSSALGVHR
jgi:hypothetical protein